MTRSRKFTADGKPYLIDAEVARYGIGWTDDPWIPPITPRTERTQA